MYCWHLSQSLNLGGSAIDVMSQYREHNMRYFLRPGGGTVMQAHSLLLWVVDGLLALLAQQLSHSSSGAAGTGTGIRLPNVLSHLVQQSRQQPSSCALLMDGLELRLRACIERNVGSGRLQNHGKRGRPGLDPAYALTAQTLFWAGNLLCLPCLALSCALSCLALPFLVSLSFGVL